MAIVDYIIIAIILISLLISVMRGFVKEAISLGTWFAAVFIALTFSDKFAALMPESFAQPSLRLGIAFISLFIITMIIGGLLKFLLGAFVDKTGLSSTDRAIGVLFGLVRGVLIVCVLVILASLTPMPQDAWWKASIFLEHFIKIIEWIEPFLPKVLQQYIQF